MLVRDPALLALRREYPQLEFHFSTQTCMANTADVAAAGQLGAARVVLAREMSLAEIAAEVFNVAARLFEAPGVPPLLLQSVHHGPPVPQNILDITSRATSSKTVLSAIQGYTQGRMGLYLKA